MSSFKNLEKLKISGNIRKTFENFRRKENNLAKLEELIPGTFKDDPVYEEMMKRSSEFYEYVKEVLSRKSKTKMNIEQATRFYGLLLLYIGKNLPTFSMLAVFALCKAYICVVFTGAFLKKVNFTEKLDSTLGKLLNQQVVNSTDQIMKNIDANVNGTGSMVLIR